MPSPSSPILTRLAIAALVTLASSAAAATPCASTEERAALDARVLQSELVVGALACGEAERYNRFVTRFRPALAASGERLKSYFRRGHGEAAESALNDLVTALANQAARRRLDWGDGYCGFVAALLDHALSIPPGEYARYASSQPFAGSHGVASCRR